MYAGQNFQEEINQGLRDCTVIAENGTKFLYEYEMPNGSSCIRNEKGKPVSYRSLSKFWLVLIENQFGLRNLIARPQQSGGRYITEELIQKLNGAKP